MNQQNDLLNAMCYIQNLYSVVDTRIYLSFLSEQCKCCTTWTQLVLIHFFWYVHILSTLSTFGSLMSKWLAKMYGRAAWSLGISSGSNKKHDHLAGSEPHPPSLFRRGSDTLALHLVCASLNSHILWVPWNFELMKHGQHYMWMRVREWMADTHIACFSFPHLPVPLSHQTLQKKMFKDKVIRNFKMCQQNVKPNMEPFWVWDCWQLPRSHAHEPGYREERWSRL